MTIQYVLDFIESARQNFETWGITSESLFIIAFAAALLFVISLREVLAWFLRVQQLRDEVRALRAQNTAIEKMLHQIYGTLNTGDAAIAKAAENVTVAEEDDDEEEPAKKAGSKRFPLDH